MSHNLRGLGGNTKWTFIKNLVCKENIKILCLQETKLFAITNSLCYTLWGDQHVESVVLLAINSTGGLLCLWNKDCFSVLNILFGIPHFRTLDCWFEDKSFRGIVESTWRELIVTGSGAFVLKEKLKGLKGKMKSLKRARQSLAVNFHKSYFGAIELDRNTVEKFADLLNYKIMTVLFIYLGIPIRVVERRRETWKPVIDKIRNKLAGWKHKTISLVGRISLINSVLLVIPLYFLFFFFRWKLGDGKEIRFWKDKWLGDQSLLESFSCIFVNSNQKQNKVADMGTWEGQEWRWCFQWRRNCLTEKMNNGLFFNYY
uniref:Uncharacterized protein n=1 Tax=Cajanus cajan TaxID=3821 RepID=A0A151SEI8_CAJCA|nr:hypothetical protein KK1_024831 [Cajanus cajan]